MIVVSRTRFTTFYQQLYRYLVRVEVEDSEGRRGSASMWVHVGLAVRLGQSDVDVCAVARVYSGRT
jgi:hypothetical protein